MKLQSLQNTGLRLRVQAWRLGPTRFAAWALSILALVVAIAWFGAIAPKIHREQNTALQAALDLAAGAAKPAQMNAVADPVRTITAALAGPEQVGIVLRDLFLAAAKAELELEQADYKWLSEPSASSRRLHISLPVKGNYSAIRALCEHLLLAHPALSLDDFALRRESVAEETALASLQFTLHLQPEVGAPLLYATSKSGTPTTQPEAPQ